jgi:hypothetical protein
VILMYAGRLPSPDGFPEANVPFVRQQVERVLRSLMPRFVAGSAAAGADLVVLEAALELGIPARVFLAGDAGEFRASSVAEDWGERYERVLAAPSVDVIEVPRVAGDEGASYKAVTERIWEAGSGEDSVVLTLSAERPGGGHTEDLATLQLGAGGLVLQLDPAATSDDRPRVFVATPGS